MRCHPSKEALTEDAVIVSALRTPVGSCGLQFRDEVARGMKNMTRVLTVRA